MRTHGWSPSQASLYACGTDLLYGACFFVFFFLILPFLREYLNLYFHVGQLISNWISNDFLWLSNHTLIYLNSIMLKITPARKDIRHYIQQTRQRLGLVLQGKQKTSFLPSGVCKCPLIPKSSVHRSGPLPISSQPLPQRGKMWVHPSGLIIRKLE